MFQRLRKPFKPKDLKQQRRQERLSNLAPDDLMKQPLSEDIAVNVERVKQILGNASDLVVREFYVGAGNAVRLVLFHIDGLVDKSAISEYILNPLLFRTFADWHGHIQPTNAFQLIRDNLATASDLTVTDKMDLIIDMILYGDVAVFVQGAAQVLLFDLKDWPSRGVQEPLQEALIRGPRDGFTETVRFNTALIRRRIRTPG